MKDVELNKSIAEILGWKWIQLSFDSPSHLIGTHPDYKSYIDYQGRSYPSNNHLPMYGAAVPDYCNDLNAAHIMEKWLKSSGEYSQRNYYANVLGGLTYNDNGRGWVPLSNDDCFPILHATARQRAEAFLKVMKSNE